MAADTFIEIFEGRLGGGKTYTAVERILAHLARGGVVFTNVKSVPAECRRYVVREWGVEIDLASIRVLTDEQVPQFVDFILAGSDSVPVLVVIDEAHLYFNSRDWSKCSRKVLAFLTQARKYRVHLVLISQSRFNLDKQFVRMIQCTWVIRDLQKLRIPLLEIPYPFPQIVRVCWDAQNPDIMIKREVVWKDRAIFRCFETRALFLERLVKEIETPPRVRRLTRWQRWTYENDRNPRFGWLRRLLRLDKAPARSAGQSAGDGGNVGVSPGSADVGT